MTTIDKTGGPVPPMPARYSDINFVVRIPGSMADYAPHIRRFVDAMVYKLKLNAHKGMWEGYSEEEAVRLLQGEVSELQEAVADGNMVEVILEAADVANFAMIAAAIAIGDTKR